MQAASQNGDQFSREERLKRVLALLGEALELLDVDEEQLELGARLQGIIDDLDDHSREALGH